MQYNTTNHRLEMQFGKKNHCSSHKNSLTIQYSFYRNEQKDLLCNIEEATQTFATAAHSSLNVVGASLKVELWTIEKMPPSVSSRLSKLHEK